MTLRSATILDQSQCFTTGSYPCSYLAGHIARAQVASPYTLIDGSLYSDLVQQGFRRNGEFVYRPHCEGCRACVSIRVLVMEFVPNRSQRRAKTQHGHLVTRVSKPHFSEEHYALFRRYQKARHADGGMDQDDINQYMDFLVNSRVDSLMVEFRDPACANNPNKIQMVSIIDQLTDGLSAVYTFFEPEKNQSYGTYNVLWQIEHARSHGLSHVYLGYWIESSRKMAYKANFRPFELFRDGLWARSIANV